MNPPDVPRTNEPTQADILRAIAHDLRQPLSSIETIAYYLSLVLPHAGEKIHAQLDEIRQLVEQANRILNRGELAEPETAVADPAKRPAQPETEGAGATPQPLGINAA